jgi:glucose-6-phosphate isomerase
MAPITDFVLDTADLQPMFQRVTQRLEEARFAEALWTRRLDVWSTDHAIQRGVANRLGWLDAPSFVRAHLPRLRTVAAQVRNEGFTDVVLLGMGGSSLAPEVLRRVVGPAPGSPAMRILDSVDPDAVRSAMGRPATSLFLLASKSGSTIEPNVLAAEARRRVEASGGVWGRQVMAITDEGTALHQRAQAEGFRDIFVNPSDIGGRYSALSFFGLLPAALMGLDLERLLASADVMVEACRSTEPQSNPGLLLGAFMAAGALAGRDKLTLRFDQPYDAFGLWVEQLVAESTGKRGKGVVPIAGEQAVTKSGKDRAIVHMTASPATNADDEDGPACAITFLDPLALGGEFFRWEVATAAAGFLLDVNPFDEPNVQQAKDATRVLLDAYTATAALPAPGPAMQRAGVRISLTAAADASANGSVVELARANDYLGLLAFLPPDDERFEPLLAAARARFTAATGGATMVGIGPRYLHSTGQLHKGGPDNGVFVIVIAPADEDLPIPGLPYSFSTLTTAQALGDFQSLDRTGRRALLVQFPRRDPALIDRTLQDLIP